MEFDLGNPFTTFQDHNSDTTPDLFESESDHMPSGRSSLLHCLRTKDSYISFRTEAISLIFQAQFSCNFEPFISYLAINYLDRYVSKQDIPQGKPWVSKLLVIACLSLAMKMKSMTLCLSDIQREDGIVFDAQTVHKMELLILDALSWRMRSITPFSFFPFFTSLLEFHDNDNDNNAQLLLKNRASEIVFTSQNDINFLEFKPSVIAASAILSAAHELFPLLFPCFKASFSTCQYINSENLCKCFNMIKEIESMTRQEYGSDIDTALMTSTVTPMSVLESKFTNSDMSENCSNDTTTSSIGQQCEEENKRRRLNGLCSGSSNGAITIKGFKVSQFRRY